MEEKKQIFDMEMSEALTGDVIKNINRHYEEAIITNVNGECPYGHKEGDKFMLTTMNHDGICGALYHAMQPALMALHYGAGVQWEKVQGVYNALCPETGKVAVTVTRKVKGDTKTLRSKPDLIDMTGKGFPGIDKYRVFIEILGVENHCMWAHRAGQQCEVDPFNIGKVCGCLYWGAYHFINILFGGGSMPWELDEDFIHGACPDIYNQTTYRLIRRIR